MNDSALKAAIQKLLSQGEKAQDSKLVKMAAAKKAPAAAPAAEACPECNVPLVEGKCAECGYVGGEDEGELAGLLEAGAEG